MPYAVKKISVVAKRLALGVTPKCRPAVYSKSQEYLPVRIGNAPFLERPHNRFSKHNALILACAMCRYPLPLAR